VVALTRSLGRIAVGNRHVAIGGHPYDLATDPNTGAPMWTQRKMPFSRNVVTAAAVPYLQGDPNFEVPRGFFRFDHGMGFQEEPLRSDQDTPGYKYGLYIDSGNGYLENGPAVTSVTPDTTSAGVKFFELLVDTTRKLIAVTVRYVLVRDADSAAGWVVSRDFGGNVITDAGVFRGTGAARTCLIVAVGASTALWTWDGTTNTTTWTQDASGDTATILGQIREEFWRSPTGYTISKTTNGGAAATWGAAFTVVDQAIAITSMAGFDNRLIIGTEQGLYAPTAAEDDSEELTPAFRYQRRSDNAVGMKAWWDSLYVPMGGSLFRYQDDGSFPEIGLGTLNGNTSEVQGKPTALCGYNNWTLFVAFYNAVQDASYLMRWGARQLVQTADGLQSVFIPGWHGALYKWAGVIIKDLLVTEVTGGPRLYAADDDGKIHYLTLPRYSMEWRADSATSFNTTNPGEVYFPAIHHGVPHEQKANLAIAAVVENLSGTARYIDFTYRTSPTDSFGGAANIQDSGRFDTDPGQRKDFTASVSSRMTELKAELVTTTSATPCVLKAIALYQNVRTSFKWVMTAGIVLSDDARAMQGYGMGRFFGEGDQFDALEAVAATAGPVAVVTPRGESFDALITDFTAVPSGRNGDGPLDWLGTVSMVQHRTTLGSEVGTWARMGSFTWSQIGVYNWSQLPNL
jgi:hypothetical protein